ncbi:MAG: Eco57I restriction-modification methylase domain-containing protein [Candidatus Hodarchaeota archaeon]
MLYKHSSIVKKKQQGQFFTHPSIAKHIVREVCESIILECFWKPWCPYGKMIDYTTLRDLLDNVLNLRFVDPAMGDGVFLIEVIRYFEEFLRELWDCTNSSSYLDSIKTYFQQKLSLDFSLVGKGDPLTLDIWKFHIIRSMIYGVDLDPGIVQRARNRIMKCIVTPEIMKLAKIAIQFNLRVGNSLISPIQMDNEAKNSLFSQYSSEISILLSQRNHIQEIHWNELLKDELLTISKKNETQKTLLRDKLFDEVVSKPFFNFLFKDSIDRELVSFLWEIEFPEVFFSNEYGFNAVIGNPPWDKWKLYDREWLGSTAIGKADYAQKITTIQKDDNESYSKYLKLKEFYKNTTEYFNLYFQWQPGEKNLFKLFFERFYNLCCGNGFMGIILPGGFLGEYYSQPLRRVLLTRLNLHLVVEIISNKEMFPDAESGLSILIIIAQKTDAGGEFPYIKGILSTEALSKIKGKDLSKNSTNLIFFTQADILKTSPKYIIPAVGNQLELKIIKKITKFPSLSSDEWGCKTSRGVDMTNDRNLLVKNVTPFPLIEGRHLVRLGFDNTHPRYWIRSFEEYQQKIPFWNQTIIVWKNFSGNHRRRRMRIAILPPKSVISNSVICLYNFPSIAGVEFYLAGIMCSVPFEFRIRQLCYGININQYVMDSMPVPLFNPEKEIHRKMVSIVKNFIPQGREWARRKMEASSSLSKARLEVDYIDTITMIDATAAVIYELSKEEFIVTLKAHPQLEDAYHEKSLAFFDSLSPKLSKM